MVAFRFAVLAITLGVVACHPPAPPKVPLRDQLTLAWQKANCRDAEALGEIALADGRIADVEVFEILGERLYVPRAWLRSPTDAAVRASTGGNNRQDPYRSALINGLEDPRCLGRVFRTLAPEADRPFDPLFRLQLEFLRSTTSTPDAAIVERMRPQTTQVVAITYEKPGAAERSRFVARAAGETRSALGDGWSAARRKITGSPDVRPLYEQVLFDERDPPRRWRRHDYDGFTWLSLSNFEVQVSEHAHVDFSLAHVVAPDRWRGYRARAVRLYNWLRTRPRERGPAPQTF
jgi:hypothetical protein